MKPSFIGLGAQKCASTWLFDVLAGHPQVGLAEPKEIDFFSYWYDFGFQWYERHFSGSGKSAVGEISPSYFHNPLAPRRLHDYAPDARLIVLLREPVSRAESNHRHEVRIGHLNGEDLSFEYGLQNNPSYIDQGRYATHLERWYRHFPRQQVMVVLVDDVQADARRVAREVFAFLGIAQDYVPAAASRAANVSRMQRFPQLDDFRKAAHDRVRQLGGESLWSLAAGSGARRLYRRLNWQAPDKVIPAAQPATRAHLKKLFEPEVLRLQDLLGRPLGHWLA